MNLKPINCVFATIIPFVKILHTRLNPNNRFILIPLHNNTSIVQNNALISSLITFRVQKNNH